MRPKAMRVLLIVLAVVVAAPAMSFELDSQAEAFQRKRKRKKSTRTAAQRRQQQIQRLRQQQELAEIRSRQRLAAQKRENSRKAADKKKETTPSERKPDTEVRAVVKSWKETQEFISKQKDKIVVVDFWASWCAPCVKELPELVALQKKYPKEVVTISFNLDNDGTEDVKKKVLPNVLKTLKKVNAVAVRNIVSSDTDEQAYKLTKLDSVPAILVFDRDGKLHKRIDVSSAGGKDVSYEKHVVPVVEKLIKSKKP